MSRRSELLPPTTEEAALIYRRDLGWTPLPLKEGTGRAAKEPHYDALKMTRGTAEWRSLREEPPDEAEIRRWYSAYPSAGVGVLTGPEIIVADLDTEAERAGAALPTSTPVVRTQRGWHLFYAAPGQPVRTLRETHTGWGCLLAQDTYAAAPPTAGRFWLRSPFWTPLAPFPSEVVEGLIPTSHVEVGTTPQERPLQGPPGAESSEAFALAALRVIGARFRSLRSVHCPLHDDRHPSAGIVRGSGGDWLLSCRACGTSLPLGVVYARSRGVRDLSGPTLAKWWDRLRYEVGTLALPELPVEIPAEWPSARRKLAEGFLLLLRIDLATVRDGHEWVGTPFTESFAIPWCGGDPPLSHMSFYRHRGALLRNGWLRRAGRLEARGRATNLWLPAGFDPGHG